MSDFINKTVLVTRALKKDENQKEDKLTCRLRELGATVIERPVINLGPPSSYEALDRALLQIQSFQWIVLASQKAAEAFILRLDHLKIDRFHLPKIATVGKSAALYLTEQGLETAFFPGQFTAEALVAEFPEKETLNQSSILWPRTLKGQTTIYDGLSALGARVTMAEAYTTEFPPNKVELSFELKKLLGQGQIDVITFTSSQAVRNFSELFDNAKGQKLSDFYPDVIVAVIGPETAQAAINIYGKVDVVAGEYTIEGLVSSLAQYLSSTNISRPG